MNFDSSSCIRPIIIQELSTNGNSETWKKCSMQLREWVEVQEVLLAKKAEHLGQNNGVE